MDNENSGGSGIKLILIPPTIIGSLYAKRFMHLLLAPEILRNPHYMVNCLQIGKGSYKILDNGAYELGRSITTEEIIMAASLVRCDELVAPDVLKDQQATFELTKSFLENPSVQLLRAHYGIKIMIVPQSVDEVSWPRSAYESVKAFEGSFDVIGVPKWLGMNSFEFRAKHLPEDLNVRKLLEPERRFAYHLLGCNSYNEAKAIVSNLDRWRAKKIRSIDTSLPFRAAAGPYLNDDEYFQSPTPDSINSTHIRSMIARVEEDVKKLEKIMAGEFNYGDYDS